MSSADKVTHFRVWCTNKWFEHSDEILDWTGIPPNYTATHYFKKYKWWLKREFIAAQGKYL